MLDRLFGRSDPQTPDDTWPERARTPFRLRPGAAFGLTQSLHQRVHARAGGDLTVALPDAPQWVHAHGLIRQPELGFTLHRFFASANPEDPDGPYPTLLSAIADTDGRTVAGETVLWHQADTIYPSSAAEWRDWLDGQHDSPAGLIGWPVFDCPLSDQRYHLLDDLVEAYGAAVEIDGEVLTTARPRALTETLRTAEGDLETRLQRVTYARMSGELVELAQLEAVDAGDAGAWVRVLKGVDLDAGELSIV